MTRILILAFFLFTYANHAFSQDNLWKTLASVTFTKVEDEDLGYQISYPVFSEDIRALNGKTVVIRGYIIPLEDKNGYFAFSAFPFQNCFFCGNAGIETVMEVYAKKPIDYTPKAVRLKGRLELNEKDMLDHLLYILRDAEQVE